MILNKWSDYLFFSSRLQAVLSRLHYRSGQAMLLETDEADEGLKITENKTISITYIFLLKYCLDLGLLHLPSWKFFSEFF